MRVRSWSWLLAVLALTLVACGDDDGGAGTGGAGTGGAGTGGSDADASTETDAGEITCNDVETLSDTIDEDTTVGPGCVRIDRTIVTNDATLTIAAGTRVLMASAGFLDISPYGDGSALVAVGTASAPIVFTSEAASPAAGDWQCVRITGASSASEVQYATFEYGGDPCETTGADYEGMLQLNSAARAISNNTFHHSLTHGVLIQPEGNVRAFDNNAFADNEKAGLRVAAPQLLTLGTGLTFADTDDRIEVDSTFPLSDTGTLLGQPVPFRVPGNLDINNSAEVTFAAGVTIQFTGGSLDVFTGNLLVEGTAERPVVFTSAAASPLKGDWGCVTFSSVNGTPRFDHAIFEYAGNGTGCTGANYETALNATETTVITNSTFRHIAGSAVRGYPCNVDAWCMNTFESVDVGPLACDFGEVPTACL